jgi:hypothetical protein
MQPFTFIHANMDGAHGELSALLSPLDDFPWRKTGDWGANAPGVGNTAATVTYAASAQKDSLDTITVQTVLNKLKDQRVNLPLSLAEGGQTVRLFTANAGRIATALRSLKRGNLKGAATALNVKLSRKMRKKATLLKKSGMTSKGKQAFIPPSQLLVAQLWLELQYGWKPLISEVQGSLALLEQETLSGKLLRIQTKRKQSIDVTTSGQSSYDAYVYYNYNQVQTGFVSIQYTMYYKVTGSGHTLAQTGLLNPLNLGWELIPFSFVVDWFLTVGAYLNSLDATVGLDFEKGCKTTFQKVSSTRKTWWTPKAGGVTNCTGLLSATRWGVYVSRTVLQDFPAPSRPVLKNPISGTHILNALALLTAVMGGGSSGRRNYRL